MIRQFIQYYRPHRKLFIADMLCAFTVAVCGLFFPMITRSMINDYIPNGNMQLLLTWGAILLGIYILKAALNYFIQYYGHVVGVRMQADMRRDLFSKLQKLPFSFFDEHKTGSIMSRIINDLMDISELAHHGPEDLFISLIMLIGAFAVLMTINIPLTLIIFACLPLLIFYAMKKRIKMSEAFTETRVETAAINANVENSIAGIRVAKSFDGAVQEKQKFADSNRAFVKARTWAYKTMADFYTGMNFIVDLLNLIVLVAGGLFTYYKVINFGDFAAYLLMVNMFLDPIKRLIAFIEQYQNGMSGFKRFTEILSAEEEHEDPEATPLERVEGRIEFQNVRFTYDESKQVLDDISFTVEPGKTVALVGPSGGGKTTLCHLVPRFYDVTGGSILLDGTDVRKITFASLRQNVGIVAQDTFLFTGTIYENIVYGRLEASEDEVIEAAKKANIHDFIISLPDGYQTQVGERGVKLSGGQKQRISIARIFLKNPPILILDEATSALDNTTELLVQQSLEELCADRTTMIVAHRLSTIRRADEILVLTDQGIVEKGPHTALMAQDGVYAALYNAQFQTV